MALEVQMKKKPKGPIKFQIQLNEEQKAVKSAILNNVITIVTGQAGSGKTLVACQAALDSLFTKEVERIIVARPVVTAKEDIGFLLARIFINRKGHFFIEGVDPLSSKYAKLGKNVVSSTLFNEISLSLSISAVEFDVYVPAYNSIGQINISQLEELSSNLGVQKVKRLGFKPDQTIDGVYDGI